MIYRVGAGIYTVERDARWWARLLGELIFKWDIQEKKWVRFNG